MCGETNHSIFTKKAFTICIGKAFGIGNYPFFTTIGTVGHNRARDDKAKGDKVSGEKENFHLTKNK